MAAAGLIHHGGPDMNYMQKLEQLAQANLDIGFRSGFQAATGNSAIGYMPGSFSPFATI